MSTTIERTTKTGTQLRTYQSYPDWLRLSCEPKVVKDGSEWGVVVDVDDIPGLMALLLDAYMAAKKVVRT